MYVSIGNYAGRGVRRLDDYYVAGRRAPTLIIVGTLVASLMSATIFLGEAGFAYAGQAGPYVLFPQTACIGYVIGAILFGRYLRRSRATTVAEFFGRRFASTRVRALAGVTIPLLLQRLRIDPALAGGVVLTTVTDVVGFMAFLGLGALLLVVALLSHSPMDPSPFHASTQRSTLPDGTRVWERSAR